MAVLKNIHVAIFKKDGTATFKVFHGTVCETLEFPVQVVEKLMVALTGWTLDDEDHCHLNNLHCHGVCEFRFGNDWEFTVNASVNYVN